MTPDEIIAHLRLAPHLEGGWYRQTWIDSTASGRPSGTAIYFLLEDGQTSHWHRVDATEIWHFYAGASLTLRLSETETGPTTRHRLGPDLAAGELPQLIVPNNHWQNASATEGWALVGCTVSPGFTFEGFTLAPRDFDIP
ncbi:cupin domain-containing protein [Tropicimonas aquimaris]|uniref:Cupin domain-containing protein n=1 Tax=Tropicimonas aquimaris TaxID=914152 RepID=A0ABW3ILL4_9RHOB